MKRNSLIEDIYTRPRRQPPPKIAVRARTVRPLPQRVHIHMPVQPPLAAKKPTSHRIRWASLAIIALFISGFFINNLKQSASGNEIITPKVQGATRDVTTTRNPPLSTADLQASIDAIIKKYPHLQISVAFEDLNSGSTLLTGVKERYVAASIAKLLAASLFLDQVEDGKYTLNDMIGGKSAKIQLKLLIEDSDNAAWTNFRNLLTHEAINTYAKKIGLQNYDSEQNLSTAADIAVVLKALFNKELLNDSNTDMMLSYMQNASESQYIPAALPQNVRVYHKAGYLKDRLHDAAIVDDGNEPFSLVIFTKANGQYDFNEGIKITHEITRAVQNAYRR